MINHTQNSYFWNNDTKEKFIKSCALHEVLEMFLSPLDYIAKSRDFNENALDKEVHTVIRTLENVLLENK